MQPTKTMSSKKEQLFILIACLFLFMGIGRIFTLVGHNPVLAYANSYDMIRLQACHQIWPADKFVDITVGTPSAPIRRYSLDKHVNTPCFPSSELLFTSIGIELAKLKNHFTDETLVSIKTIGLVKAIFLSVTILLASLFFYRNAMYPALLTNALITAVVLSDPGITLYMSTFYTEFSAVYFLYLALIGVVTWATSQYRFTASWVLLLGLLGLSFSKQQYMPLALCIAVLLSIYALSQKRWSIIPALLLCTTLPLILQAANWYTPRNASMVRTNNINFTGSLLAVSENTEITLRNLGLPKSCKVIAGKNGYDAALQKTHACPELDALPTFSKLNALINQPTAFGLLAIQVLEQQKNWVFDLYGQVEKGRYAPVAHYQRTLGSVLKITPTQFFAAPPVMVILIALVLLVIRNKTLTGNNKISSYLLLSIIIQVFIIFYVIFQSGTVNAAKNLHLYFAISTSTLILATVYLIMPSKKLTE